MEKVEISVDAVSLKKKRNIIKNIKRQQVRKGCISYGVSSYGYDIRISDEFKIFTNVNNAIVDPKDFDSKSFVDFKGNVCIIPPNSFALGMSVEYFRIPRNVMTICVGRSTNSPPGIPAGLPRRGYASLRIVCLEISNTT